MAMLGLGELHLKNALADLAIFMLAEERISLMAGIWGSTVSRSCYSSLRVATLAATKETPRES